jgi:hypothetical protein
MRRVLAVSLLVLAAACGREQPQPSTATTSTTEAPPARTPAPATTSWPPARTPAPATTSSMTPAPAAAPKARLTPDRCNGDGSYPAAVDCFRQTAGFHFAIAEGSARAEGDMARTAVGAESIRFHLSGTGAHDGDWLGISKGTVISWLRNGKRVTAEPPIADTVYQRTTLSFDPQKKEKEAQLAGMEMVDGVDCNHYRFTDANNGDTHDVWISRASGDLVKTKIVPSAAFRSTRKDFTMSLSKHGERVAIDAPR